MAIGGKEREQVEFSEYVLKIGLFEANVIAINPDKEEYEKISKAVDEMMRKSLELGGAPYSKGRLWGPLLNEFLGETGYWNLANSIKAWLDPNNIMNSGVLGLKGSQGNRRRDNVRKKYKKNL